MADHVAHERGVIELPDRRGHDLAAVAQHGHPIGELEYLVEAVRDEEDEQALLLQCRDDPEQAVAFGRRQYRGRLVEDQQPRRQRQRPRQLDELLGSRH
jgi:hypothetical protein